MAQTLNVRYGAGQRPSNTSLHTTSEMLVLRTPTQQQWSEIT